MTHGDFQHPAVLIIDLRIVRFTTSSGTGSCVSKAGQLAHLQCCVNFEES